MKGRKSFPLIIWGIFIVFNLMIVSIHVHANETEQKIDRVFEIKADGTIQVDGLTFKNFSEYFQSDYFKKAGKRCGTKVLAEKKSAQPTSTSHCTLNQTITQNEYWPSDVYVIPVVFHIIYNSSGTGNISNQRVYDQIQVMNEDFRSISGTLGANGYDTKIEFQLVEITRTSNTTWFNDQNETQYKSSLGWDQDRYLNIYSNSASGYLGYAYLPQDLPSKVYDGVVVNYDAVGGRGDGSPPYNQGRTLVHEVGHYLGLLHTFEGYGCYNGYYAGDLIADTNSENTDHYGCTQTSTCGTSDPIHNYMNYTDDICMYRFSRDQANRLVCSLVNYRPLLYDTQGSTSIITVTSPNGGETLTVGDNHTITWTTTGTVGNVKIQYFNENNPSGVTIVSTTANDGSYSWTVPNDVSTQCRVRISAVSDSSVEDYSNSYFSIEVGSTPVITVTSPNGNESWTVGSNHNITWTSSGFSGNVKIRYYNENNLSGVTIVSSTTNDGTYTWTIPDDVSSLCAVRISSVSNPSVDDYSDNKFSIVSAAGNSLTVTSPNGSEIWDVGSTRKIKWSSTGTVGNVKIQYFNEYNLGGVTIISSTANDGSYNWTVPNDISSYNFIKISEAADGNPQDSSDDYFSIVSASTPTITVNSPNGGETLTAGGTTLVTWSSTGTVGNVKLQYSTNKGSSWSTIVSSTTNDGSYNWTVPSVESSQCLVKISEASDGNPFDISNNEFSISNQAPAAITVVSPNGGENLESGSSFDITWTSSGDVGNVKIQYSADNGVNWTTIRSSSSNSGAYAWTVPDRDSSQCIVKVSKASSGSPSDISDNVFSIYSSTPPEITLNRTHLIFGADTSGLVTGNQTFLVNNSGGGTLEWEVNINRNWLNKTPSSGDNTGLVSISVIPGGLPVGSYNGTITVTDTEADNSPQYITVILNVYQAGLTGPPFGEFSTPVQGSIVRGSIPFSGWVLDDIEVKDVKIYNGSDYIGDAVFVEGARPDVEQAFPTYPKNHQAGWGYMLLSNFLPNGGNGVYTFFAKTTDSEGNQVTLGSKTITIDNINAVKPFGAIDTPTQGGIASGNNFINWGWVLTPQPNRIPIDGSSIKVYVDGVNLGNPVYNIYRSDIASLFPGYANSNGAIGRFTIDTTKYEDGVHTIYWTATDNGGNSDGIGSRYFIIQNSGNNRVTNNHMSLQNHRSFKLPVRIGEFHHKSGRADLQLNFNETGMAVFEIKELQPLEVNLGKYQWEGYLVLGDQLKPLPIGSFIDLEKGTFYWGPGTGFYGLYELVFINKETGQQRRINIHIKSKGN